MRRWLLAAVLLASGADAVPRQLILFADSAADPALAAQRAVVRGAAAGLAERDIRVAERIGAGGAMRTRYGVAVRGYHAVLVGRDGGVKLRSRGLLSAAMLFGTVDAMPMRQSELQRP